MTSAARYFEENAIFCQLGSKILGCLKVDVNIHLLCTYNPDIKGAQNKDS